MTHRRRSSSNSSHSFIDSISQDDLIEYFPRAFLPNIQTEIDIMNKIKRQQKVRESGVNSVGLKYINEFHNNKQILFCIITPGTRQIPLYEFKFTFNLYIPSWRAASFFNNHHRRNRRKQYDSYQKIFLKYTFTANHEQINRIHSTIEYKMNNSGHLYFARKPYPKPLPETIKKRKKYGKKKDEENKNNDRYYDRGIDDSIPLSSHKDLNEEMESEQKYYKLPDLPYGKPATSWWKRKNASTQHDLYEYAEYLQIIFNSPSLCIQDFIYDELEFDHDIKQVLQQKAQCKLDALNQSADKIHLNTIDDPTKLLAKEYRTKYNTQFNQSRNTSRNMQSSSKIKSRDDKPLMGQHRNRIDNMTNINCLQHLGYRYHTVYIVSRPIDSPTLNMAGINHWALKFEGIHHLMTVGFFYDDNNKGSKILCNIMRNSKMNRRIFWYWWPRYYLCHDDEEDPQFFNTNWKVIDTVYLGTMSTECIGRLINRWLTKYHRYVTATNNCQHFARDMISVMNMDVARKLPAFFDNKIITAIIPAAAAAGIMSEEARMLEVADMLSSEIEKYINIVEKRLASENESENDIQFDDKRSNSINSIAWNECTQFIADLSDDDDDDGDINNNEFNNNDNRNIYNEYNNIEEEEVYEENVNDDVNSDVNSESKDDEKQEMENITPQNEIDVETNNVNRNRYGNIVDKGLSETSQLIAERIRGMKKTQDEMENIMEMINDYDEMRDEMSLYV